MKTLKRGPELYALIKPSCLGSFLFYSFFRGGFCLSALPFLRPSIAIPRPGAFAF